MHYECIKVVSTMNPLQFYEKISKALPVTRSNQDFREDLKNSLSEYLESVKQLEDNLFSDGEKANIIAIIDDYNKQICAIVDMYYDGMHNKAFQKFASLLNGKILPHIGIHTITTTRTRALANNSELQIWFRARVFHDRQIHSHKEMFHIPLNMRELVNTQRYSAPGYPCLYLGNTIYSCWEEMHRPRFDDVMFSGFKVVRDFNVYDLRIPKKSEFENADWKNILFKMPLVISCMIKVRNYDYPYKPEYIIPQLLVHTIISNNRNDMEYDKGPNDMAWGVIYTSTHVSQDFPYGVEYLENIALPVIKNNDNTYCQVLASLFKISDPICYEYESLKENNARVFWQEAPATYQEQIQRQYKESKMGYLEDRIRDNTKFYRLDHIYVNAPETITLSHEGGSATVDVVTNLSFKVY